MSQRSERLGDLFADISLRLTRNPRVVVTDSFMHTIPPPDRLSAKQMGLNVTAALKYGVPLLPPEKSTEERLADFCRNENCTMERDPMRGLLIFTRLGATSPDPGSARGKIAFEGR